MMKSDSREVTNVLNLTYTLCRVWKHSNHYIGLKSSFVNLNRLHLYFTTPYKVSLAAKGCFWIFQSFYVLRCILSCWMDNFVWWRCVFGQFSSYCGPTQMVTNNQTWCVTSLSMSDYCCDCEEVLATIWLVFVGENQYFEPKIVYKWCTKRKPTSPIELPMLLDDDLHIDEEGYPELQLVISDFANTLIDFYPKEAMEFTATALAFNWEVAQHITAVKI